MQPTRLGYRFLIQCRLVKMLIPAGEDTRRGESVAGVSSGHQLNDIGFLTFEF